MVERTAYTRDKRRTSARRRFDSYTSYQDYVELAEPGPMQRAATASNPQFESGTPLQP